MKKIAVVSAILEEPRVCQKEFNDVVSSFNGCIRGRMGIPFFDGDLSVISITMTGSLDDINSFTGKLGNITGVTVKTAIARKEIDD